MAEQSLVKQLLEAGVHYGHKAANWNPKMSPYVFAKRNRIHIIDVRQTIKGLLLAKKFLTRVVAEGKDVLFVGTKRQARDVLQEKVPAVGMHYVTERWLGGTLTNFETIRSRLKRLDELDELMSGEEWHSYSKKMASQLDRERRKIQRNLGGIRTMSKLPGAVVVIDVRREHNALHEAQKLGIPTVCLIDTDSDPDLADVPIPGNDDAIRAIDIIVDQLTQAVAEGKTAQAQQELQQKAGEQEQPRRRSSRAQFRADEPAAEPETGSAAEGEAAESARSAGESSGGGESASEPPAGSVAPAQPTEQDGASNEEASPQPGATPQHEQAGSTGNR